MQSTQSNKSVEDVVADLCLQWLVLVHFNGQMDAEAERSGQEKLNMSAVTPKGKALAVGHLTQRGPNVIHTTKDAS